MLKETPYTPLQDYPTPCNIVILQNCRVEKHEGYCSTHKRHLIIKCSLITQMGPKRTLKLAASKKKKNTRQSGSETQWIQHSKTCDKRPRKNFSCRHILALGGKFGIFKYPNYVCNISGSRVTRATRVGPISYFLSWIRNPCLGFWSIFAAL